VSARPLLVQPGRLLDGTGAPSRADAALLVCDGRIAAVGPVAQVRQHPDAADARVVDAAHQTVLPGLVDGHVHAAWGKDRDAGWASARADRDLLLLWTATGTQAALRAGVTTLRDCGAPGDVTLKVKRSLADGVLAGPRFLVCGPSITTTSGHGEYIGVTADSADELRRTVRELCRQGADFIKIMATGGTSDPADTNRRRAQYSQAELEAGIADAHRLGRLVVTHVNATEGIRNAVAAGADALAHCNWLGEAEGTIDYDPAVADEIVRRRLFIDLNVEGATRPLQTGDGRLQDWSMPAAPQNRWDILGDLRRRGAPIFLSSDGDGPALGKFPGQLVEAQRLLGLSAEELIWRVTGVAAAGIGRGDQIGTLETGKQADFVVLDGDLATEPRALLRVHQVYLGGRLVVQDGWLAAAPALGPSPWEDPVTAAMGVPP